ncbi:MAG: site-2 protease family protein [Bacillota bacterium]|nr:site-2 protease family protein [Bacillota bacterium]
MDDRYDIDNNENNSIPIYHENPEVGNNNSGKKKGILAALGGLVAIMAKFKVGLLLLLGKLKFLFILLKLGKILTTSGSMLLMILIYAKLYGWPFGIGFVILLFFHEMGHYITAKRLKLDVSGPVFIPFLGAFINMKEQPNDAVIESKIALGGPVLGSIASLTCVLLYWGTNKDFYLALAYSGFIINLFNLIPVHPLDGGRIVSSISTKIWLIGIPVMLLVLIKYFNPFLLIFLVLGAVQAFHQWKSPDVEYYSVKPSTRIIFGISYFGLLALLAVGLIYIHNLQGYLIH